MKKTAYPSKIKVGKAHYSVVIMPHLGDDVTVGYCEDKVKLIALYRGLSDKNMFSALLHELLHACQKEHGVKLKHKQVYALEAALSQVFSDNFVVKAKRPA